MYQKRYEFMSNIWMIVLGIFLFGACTYSFANQALHDDREILLNGLITLSVDQAHIFMGVLSFLSLLLTLAAVAGVFFKIKKGQMFVDLYEDHIRFPGSLFAKEYKLSYKDIIGFSEKNISGTKIFEMKTAKKNHGLSNRMLKNNKEYEDFKAEILKRCPAVEN